MMDVMYPRRCPVCDRALSMGGKGVCPDCTTKLEYVREPVCIRCGKPLDEEQEYCGDCQGKKTFYIQGRSALVYNSWMRASVSRLKYHGRREYAEEYANILYQQYGEWIRRISPQALIPVPVHPHRKRKRGFNQAEEIAAVLSRKTGIPLNTKLLYRCKDTLPQKELSGAARRRNLQEAFCVKESGEVLNPRIECVILIDDIFTTGSTVEACSSVLYKSGIRRIYFLCVCVGKGF